MKRIFYDRNGRVQKPFFPFWQPWGCWGCLWRALLFLLSMVLIALLIAWLTRSCNNEVGDTIDPVSEELPEEGPVRDTPYAPIRDIPPALTDSTIVEEWSDSIPGVAELPRPKDNILPPVDSMKVKPSPEDSIVNVVSDQIIVLFNSKDLKADMTSFARQFKAAYPSSAYSIIYYNPSAGTMLLQVPEERLYAMLSDIPLHVTGIDYKLTTNPLISTEDKPSDPGFKDASYDRYFSAIQAYDAWDITRGDAEVVVGIVDTYFCLDHPEIGDRYVNPIHIPTKTRNVLPRTVPAPPFRNLRELEAFATACHGSHVAGIAIGGQDNGSGTSGIAPRCRWIPISVGNSVPLICIMEGILYGIYQGADVINISMGLNYPSGIDKAMPLTEQARRTRETFKHQETVWNFIYKAACDHNCVICTSAGNANIIMGVDASKRSPLVIKVEATDPDGKTKADFSNFGTIPSLGVNISTVSAPGVAVLSSVAWGKYFIMDGTSQATPFVTGAVALMKSLRKDLRPDEIIEILQRTGKPVSGNQVGPLIQIKDALDMIGGKTDTMMVYQEVVDNHEKLLGRWEGTTLQILTEEGKELDKIRTIMEFQTTEKGVVEFHTQESHLTYTAPLQISWGKGTINIHQLGKAVCTTDPTDKITQDDYICRPDSKGLMEVSVIQSGSERFKFNMRKIK